MSNPKKAFALAMLLVAASSVFAQKTVDQLLSERGISLVSRDASSGKTLSVFASSSGLRFSVESTGSVGPAAAASALNLLDALSTLKSVTPGILRFRVDGNSVKLRVIPASFIAGGTDLKPFVPSGLSFSDAGGVVEYDFRVKSGPYFLRFNGRMQNETAFLERLTKAIADPAIFARDNDPDYLGRRIVELQEALDASDAKTAALEARLSEFERKAAHADASLERVRSATIAVYSKGLFGAPKPVPEEILAAVAELKAARPELSADAIAAALKEKGLSASSRQINAILAVVYGE